MKIDKTDILAAEGDKKFGLYTNRKLDFESKIGELTLKECLTTCEFRDELFQVDSYQFKTSFKDKEILIKKK